MKENGQKTHNLAYILSRRSDETFWHDMIRRMHNLGGRELSTPDQRSMAISGPQHAHRIKKVERARGKQPWFVKVLHVSQRHTSGPKAGKFQTTFHSPDMRMCT
jgi:hypothetical protein